MPPALYACQPCHPHSVITAARKFSASAHDAGLCHRHMYQTPVPGVHCNKHTDLAVSLPPNHLHNTKDREARRTCPSGLPVGALRGSGSGPGLTGVSHIRRRLGGRGWSGVGPMRWVGWGGYWGVPDESMKCDGTGGRERGRLPTWHISAKTFSQDPPIAMHGVPLQFFLIPTRA